MTFEETEARIPFAPGQAVSRGWTDATHQRPAGVTWHWTVTWDLVTCRRVLGGANAERKGEASAHYGVGRTYAEGIDRYVSIEDRSWHAGINQTLRWDGLALGDARFKGSRTTIGVETVTIGYARGDHVPAEPDWITAADPTGKFVMKVQPWTGEQIDMMVAVGMEILERWPHIGVRDHHGHHDICPGYKQDVAGFPFAAVLRRLYPRVEVPDVWTPLLHPRQRQQALANLGYGLGSFGVDGSWGRFSDAALRTFQRDNGLVADGMWTSFVNWKIYEQLKAKRQPVVEFET